jgi:ketosteroid isomerase-like protein
MSEENVEVVRRVYATGCWNSEEDPRAALPYLADDGFEFVNPAHAVVPGTRHGHEGFIKAMRSATEALSYWHHEPLAFRDCGDCVLVDIDATVRGLGSGIEITRPEWHIWTLREGKVIRLEWVDDRRKALEVAGVSESKPLPCKVRFDASSAPFCRRRQ